MTTLNVHSVALISWSINDGCQMQKKENFSKLILNFSSSCFSSILGTYELLDGLWPITGTTCHAIVKKKPKSWENIRIYKSYSIELSQKTNFRQICTLTHCIVKYGRSTERKGMQYKKKFFKISPLPFKL